MVYQTHISKVVPLKVLIPCCMTNFIHFPSFLSSIWPIQFTVTFFTNMMVEFDKLLTFLISAIQLREGIDIDGEAVSDFVSLEMVILAIISSDMTKNKEITVSIRND